MGRSPSSHGQRRRSGAQWVLVAYDVPDDDRRRRLHALLESFGVGVQYSVFACALSRAELVELRRRIDRVVKGTEDEVLIVPLCARCGPRVGAAVPPDQYEPTVLV